MSTKKSTPHSHPMTRGSMKLSHNLDDRQERIECLSIPEETTQVKADWKQVQKKYSNLGWLNTRSSTKQ